MLLFTMSKLKVDHLWKYCRKGFPNLLADRFREQVLSYSKCEDQEDRKLQFDDGLIQF